ncbi:hypothetical protein ACHQM5_000444 [Ranunculus cassubicifolius]
MLYNDLIQSFLDALNNGVVPTISSPWQKEEVRLSCPTLRLDCVSYTESPTNYEILEVVSEIWISSSET